MPAEDEIIRNWQDTPAKPAISVVCMAYNQEQYIHDAMLGFLMQKTTFPFEIIVHDDASTDATSGTIRDYQARYPRIIRSIIQVENQYSQRPSSVALFPTAIAEGEYIALCEGDDFWFDESKLQIQYDALRARPEIDFCFHRTVEMFCDKKEPDFKLTNEEEGDTPCVLGLDEIIRHGGGMMKTASIVLRRDIFMELPDWYGECPVFDYSLKIIGSRRNGALYLPDTMCVYRIAAQGSWTANLSKKYEKFVEDQELSLQRLEHFIDGRYKRAIRKARSRLAMSASSYHFDNRQRKQCKAFALRSLKLAGRIKTQAIRNILFCSSGLVFRLAYSLRMKLRAITAAKASGENA